MRYRPTTEPKGKWAIAINAKRRADKLSRTAAFEILGPKLGYSPKSLSAYRLLDTGERQPDEDEQKVLAEWLGYWPTDDPESAGGISETAQLVKAISALVEEMRLAREDQATRQREEIAEAVREAVAPLWALVRDATRLPVE